MFAFEYRYSDYQLLIEDMARQLHVSPVGNTLHFPKEVADGYYRLVTLPNGLQANLIDCTFNCDWYLHRQRSEEEFYTLRFDEFTLPGKLVTSIDGEKQTDSHTSKSIIYLTSSRFDFSYLGSAGTKARAINILIKPEWLCNFLGIPDVSSLLKSYLELKAESYVMAPVDKEYMTLMDEILYRDMELLFSNLYLLNRIQLLIERFFSRMHERLQQQQRPLLRLNTQDINCILHAEMVLTENFTQKPPPIAALARQCMMSPSKFKTNFKVIFGLPVYAHYQHKRLQKARDLLVTGKYNVAETAAAVAYDNTSNFIAAYKRQYHVSPGAMLSR